MSFTVKGFDHVFIPADDVQAMREFYQNVIGLSSIEPRATGYDKFEMAWLETEGGEVHIARRDPSLSEFTGSPFNQTMQKHIAFEIDDIEAAKESLEAMGYTYYEQQGEGVIGRAQIYVTDPAGLTVELYQAIDA